MEITTKLINVKSNNNKYIKKYKLIDLNGYLEDSITKRYNIYYDEIYYFGTFQGYKIYLDNKKYPLRKGYFYAGKHLLQAILEAIKEKTKSKLNDYFIENQNILWGYKMTEVKIVTKNTESRDIIFKSITNGLNYKCDSCPGGYVVKNNDIKYIGIFCEKITLYYK